MFHPKEEERDAFWLKISFSAMFSIALILTIYSSYLPGVKYFLLSQFGATSTADIVRLDHATVSHEQFLAFEQGELSEDELIVLLKKAGPNAKYFYLTVEFKPHEGAPTETLRLPVQIDSDESLERLASTLDGTQLDITFLKSNPSIAYPTEWLGDYRFDMKILLVASAILAFVLWTLIKTVGQLREFQRKMKRY